MAALVLTASMLAASVSAADQAPSWLTEIAARETPAYEEVVSAVVLLEEEKATVSPDGIVTTTVRKAVKVLTRAGRSEAAANTVYSTDSSKVRRLEAWTIYPSGQVKKYGKKDVADLSLAENDVYNEVRLRRITGAGDADPGAVFGYESVVEDRSIFTQFSYRFQDDLPALTSRFVLEMPPGWTAKAVTFNADPIEPSTDGSQYVWQLDGLAPIVDEAASPRLTSLAPRIAVSYFPSEAARAATGPAFETWNDVSEWLAMLSDPQAAADEAIRAKTNDLIAGATTPFDRVAAIGRFAQDIKYVSIQIGVGSGGGYTPHAATEVLAKAYGDCKDKANLMRAMLSTLDIASYPLTVYSRDPSYVVPSWPSPRQFDHAIIAVAAPEGYDGPAAMEHERYGRLLVFDPTDPYTPFGELREGLQGGRGLLIDAAGGDLIELPRSPPRANLVRREVELQLSADGTISGEIAESSSGEAASREVRNRQTLAQADYRRYLEYWLTNQAPSAALAEFETATPSAGLFDIQVKFSAPRYGRTMGNKLLIFEPAVVSRRGLRYPMDEDRHYPVVLRSQAFDEIVRVRLPEGFAIDELPPPLELDADFGSYRAKCTTADGVLRFERTLEIENAEIPADRYGEVRDFFGKIGGLEQTPVVLARP